MGWYGAPPGVADNREAGALVTNGTEETVGKVCPDEFKRQAVELYRLHEATTYADVSRDLAISAETIHNWCRAADRDEGRVDDGR